MGGGCFLANFFYTVYKFKFIWKVPLLRQFDFPKILSVAFVRIYYIMSFGGC